MTRAREWVRLDVGLLDDERFNALPLDQQGVWLAVYLLLAREGDAVKSFDRLAYLLERRGGATLASLLPDLRAAGWFVRHSQGGYTLRGYEDRQFVFHRGPSDDPEAKAARNAKRPTTRAGRRGATVERRTVGEGIVHYAPARGSGATEGVAPRGGPMKSAKELLRENGYDPEKPTS